MLLKAGFRLEAEEKIKEQLVSHLNGGEAFMTVDEMLKKMEFEKLGERPGNLPYSFFELFYHIKFTQKDIIDYCNSTHYRSFEWPHDYWPQDPKPLSNEAWENLKKDYFEEREQFINFILDPDTELMRPVREGTRHTLLREVLLVIEHTAYHTGQLLIVLRNLGLHR